ncbi:MAG: DUF1257 domain-containing protein [Candidatus Nanoarchaeia archaeon]|nr:DUF1257 domain-containing protein [Candidatus Nanoarchaeia archaeon]
MSHFSTVRTEIKNRDHLVSALKQMNYSVKTGNYQCRGYQGNTQSVELLIENAGSGYDLGFRNNNGNYELVADWYGIKGVNSDQLINNIQSEITKIENKIKQEYAYNTVKEKLLDQGFEIDDELREDGEIRIKLSRIV